VDRRKRPRKEDTRMKREAEVQAFSLVVLHSDFDALLLLKERTFSLFLVLSLKL